MRYRNAVFAVAYALEKDKIYYLILKRKLHWTGWEFPKGGVSFLETKRNTVKREIKEETGLKVLKIEKFNIFGKYKYDKMLKDRPNIIGQKFSLYAVEVKKGKVKISEEHSDYRWADFNEAMKKLTWENQKKSLKFVNNLLTK